MKELKETINSTKLSHIFIAVFIMFAGGSIFAIADGFLPRVFKPKHTRFVLSEVDTVKEFFTASVGNLSKEINQEMNYGYILDNEGALEQVVNAKSYLIGDLDTGEIILSKDRGTNYPIASITKYLTAIASLETLDQNEVARVSEEAVSTNGSRAQLHAGDTIKVGSLLYPLILVSSNDAAEVLARHKNREEFLEYMNSRALDFGMNSTYLDDVSGLSAGNYSTASDLFKLMRVVKNDYPEILDISRLKVMEIDGKKWININDAHVFPGFFGGKTGYTNAAGQTSVGYYKVNFSNGSTRDIGIIILQSKNREEDALNILDYLQNNVSYFEE